MSELLRMDLVLHRSHRNAPELLETVLPHVIHPPNMNSGCVYDVR